MARLLTNGFELGQRGASGSAADLLFWDADETHRDAGTIYTDASVVRVSGRSLKVDPGAGSAWVAHHFSGAEPECWVRCAYRRTVDNNPQNRTNSILIVGVGGGSDVSVRINHSTQLLSIWRGASQLAIESVQTIDDGEWFLLELHCKFSTNALEGKVELRVDGADDLSWTGNSGALPPTGLRVGLTLDDFLCADTHWFDDVALNDSSGTINNSWVGDGHVVCLRPNGNGSRSEMVGSDADQVDNWALVDEVPVAVADYVEALEAGKRDSYQLQSTVSLGMPAGCTVKHCESVLVGTTLNVGADAASGSVRTGGVDYYAAKRNLGAEWGTFRFPFPLNPSTNLPWTTAELDAAEAGVRSESA